MRTVRPSLEPVEAWNGPEGSWTGVDLGWMNRASAN